MGIQTRITLPNLRKACSTVCRDNEESLDATAVTTAAWLLIEVPGGWPGDDLPSHLSEQVTAFLQDAESRGIRLQLIQQPESSKNTSRRIYTAWTRGEESKDIWMEACDVDNLDALLDLDIEALAAGRRPSFGNLEEQAILLGCTHGNHDPCCGRLGYPAMKQIFDNPELAPHAWRTTHVGGDRFAPNLVCLPYGTYHGRVPPEDAPKVAALALQGRVLLRYYRGRAGYSRYAQAAEVWAREQYGADEVFSVQHIAEHPEGDHTLVDLRVAGKDLQVPVRNQRLPPRPLNCRGIIGEPIDYFVESVTSDVGLP